MLSVLHGRGGEEGGRRSRSLSAVLWLLLQQVAVGGAISVHPEGFHADDSGVLQKELPSGFMPVRWTFSHSFSSSQGPDWHRVMVVTVVVAVMREGGRQYRVSA